MSLDCLQQRHLYLSSISVIYRLSLKKSLTDISLFPAVSFISRSIYVNIPILKTYFIFIFYACICYTLKRIVHILILLNLLFKVLKCIEKMRDKLSI